MIGFSSELQVRQNLDEFRKRVQTKFGVRVTTSKRARGSETGEGRTNASIKLPTLTPAIQFRRSGVVVSESEAAPKVSITVSLDLSPKRDPEPPDSDTEIQTNFDNSFKRSK